MLRACLIFILLNAVPGVVLAAGGSLKQAAKLLDRNYYESAAAMLRAGVSDGDPASVAFLLGRAYLRDAQLQTALQRSSLAAGTRYLQKLAGQSGRERSRYALLYYGDYLIESGNKQAGSAQLQKFMAQAETGKAHRQIAAIRLAAANGGALPAATGLEAEARTELAAALSRNAAKQVEAVALLERTLGELRKHGSAPPMRAVTNALAVYTHAGQYDKALALLGTEDLGRPSYLETLGKSKTLRFYDAALIGNLAALYQAAGEQQMERARSDARLKAVVSYFLADVWLAQGRADKAGVQLAQLAGAGELPPAYRERVATMQAAVDVRGSQVQKGNAAFTALSAKYSQDPVQLGELLMICLQAKGKCGTTAGAAQTLASTGQGERFRGLHRALGMLHAEGGRHERALQYLETARDKSNKNRIDTNDPLLLVQLADLYMTTKSFSENLEIYFELSKEFPAVRQLQELGQGIYSMEYRSAGDVKIF